MKDTVTVALKGVWKLLQTTVCLFPMETFSLMILKLKCLCCHDDTGGEASLVELHLYELNQDAIFYDDYFFNILTFGTQAWSKTKIILLMCSLSLLICTLR